MKTRTFLFGRLLIPAAALVTFTGSALAASQIWDGDTDANWTTAGNWVGGGVPGINPTGNGDNTTDTATFNAAITGFGDAANPIIIDTNRMIGRLVFDTANAGAYSIGATSGSPTLMLGNNLTVIDVKSAVVNAQTINAAIGLHLPSSTNGAATIQNNATSSSATLTLVGGIVNSPNSTRGTVWTLGGSNTGENTVSGAINIGNTGGISSSLIKTGIGTWVLTGANTIPGGVTINGGTLAAANNTALGSSGTANNNAVNINSTGTLEIRTGITLDNGLSLNLNNGGTIKGVGTAATNGRVNVGTAAGTSVTVSVVGASDVFTIGNGSNDFTGGASDSVVHISGAGTVFQSAASNYVGTWSVDSGTLRLGSATALGTQSSTMNVASGGKLQINGQNWTFTNLTGTGTIENGHASTAVTLTLDKSSASTFGGILQNGGSATLGLTKSGASTLTLTGQNAYTGTTIVNAGSTLALNRTNQTGQIIASGSALQLTAGANLTLTGNATTAGTQTFASTQFGSAGLSSVSVTELGGIAQNVNLGAITRNAGTGAMVDFTLPTVGTIQTTTGTAGAALSTSGSYYATVGGSTWAVKDATNTSIIGANSTFYKLASTGGLDAANMDMDANTTVNSATNDQYNSVRFNDSTAARTVNVGSGGTGRTLTLGSILVTSNVGANNSVIKNNSSGSSYVRATASSGSDMSIFQNNASGWLDIQLIFANASGTNPLSKSGAGTLVLSNTANAYAGTTNINGGTISIAGNGSLGAIATGAAVNLNNGSLFGNATITLDNAGANKRAIFLNGVGGGLSASAGNTLTVSGVVSGSGKLSVGSGTLTGTGAGTANTTAIVGSGTVSLGGANSFTGDIDINAGILAASLASNSTNPTTGSVGNAQTVGRIINVNNGGTLRFDNGDVMGGAGSTVQTGLVINTGGTVSNNGTSFNTLGAVTLNGGTLTGTGGSSNGQFQMYAFGGTVTAGGSSASTISSAVGTTNGGTAADTVGYHLGTAVTSGTTFNVADATSSSASDLNVSAALIDRTGGLGAASLTKAGSGTMTLTGTSTYTGATTVSAGTLLVNGALGNTAVTVTGGTLGGTGTIGGGVTVNSGAFLAPGASIESLAVASAVINGTLVTEYDGTGSGTIDLLAVTGILNITGATVDFNQLGATLDDACYIFATYGSLTGSAFATVTDLPTGYDIDYAYNDGITSTNIALVAVPEPAAALLGGLGMLVLLRRRRN